MKDKKKIAAIAAVADYIKSQQGQRVWSPPHALQEPAVMGVEADAPVPSPIVAQQVISNFWGAGGRHQQMQMRSLMQMKSFHRSKPMA